jgi:hypothetical protein
MHKLYSAHYREATELQQSCSYLGNANYATPNQEALARRAIAATLQYIGLDATVKAIGAYAHKLQMPQADYETMVNNLVKSSCSPNLTVYGIKFLRLNLMAAYRGDRGFLIPRQLGYPYSSVGIAHKANSVESREAELHHTVKNFRAFCSWGGDVTNYRLLPPLLASPQIMGLVYRHLEGKALTYDEKTQSVVKVDAPYTSQVTCDGPICRAGSAANFARRFPLMLGSSGLKQDLQRLWCNHFRYQTYSPHDQPSLQVREWIKEQEPEDERKDVAQMVALFTGISDRLTRLECIEVPPTNFHI